MSILLVWLGLCCEAKGFFWGGGSPALFYAKKLCQFKGCHTHTTKKRGKLFPLLIQFVVTDVFFFFFLFHFTHYIKSGEKSTEERK